MIIASWNVNGLRAAANKGFLEWVDAFGPDVVLLQETKAREEDLPRKLVSVDGYERHFHAAQRKGYSGVAVYARERPDEWLVGIGDDEFDTEGRVLGARFGQLLVVSVYFPNSQQEGRRLDYRLAFNRRFAQFLDEHRQAGRSVVIGGDFNVAHEEIDIARPKSNTKNPGFLPEERAWMSEFLDDGWVDTWRRRNPDRADVYSWWSYRFGARGKNIGWRLDYMCVDESLWPRVVGAEVLHEVLGSDHCPVTLELEVSP
ncbi:MAG: exodeoxyribonuclease III [Planctomycetes bacterium]|nr:exodeoxyribonuclease III [Planctomycetota bacterium]